MAIAEISIVPIGTGTTSVSAYVAGAIEPKGDRRNIDLRTR